jgi:chemotaxis protein CheX
MMGCPDETLETELIYSGIAELSNCIAGRACINLSEVDYQSDITTPTLLLGSGSRVSTVNIPRVCMHLNTEWGMVDLQIALAA